MSYHDLYQLPPKKQREKVPKKWTVGQIVHQSWPNDPVPVALCPATAVYWLICPIAGMIETETFEALERKWRSIVEAARLEGAHWEPVIIAKRVDLDRYNDNEDDTQRDVYVGFEQLTRSWRASVVIESDKWRHDNPLERARPERTTVWRAWDDKEGITKPANWGRTGMTRKHRNCVPLHRANVLPYSERAWMVLTRARDTLVAMHAQLDELLNQKPAAIVAQLEAIPAGRMLTMTEPTDQE